MNKLGHSLSNQFHNNFFDRASQFGDRNTLSDMLKNPAGSHVQHSNPDAIQASVRHQDIGGKKKSRVQVGRSGVPAENNVVSSDPQSIQQAQHVLENSADRLAVNAREFQNFLSGGRSGMANWSQTRSGGNIASQLSRAGISFLIRG